MKIRNILLLLIVLAAIVNAQTGSINNTLGTGGSFNVRDVSNNFFRVDQSTGNSTFYRNVEMGLQDFSGSTIGVIRKNGKRFLHNYKTTNSFGNNLFLGLEAGNFTMLGSVGNYTLSSYNIGIGDLSLYSLNAGYENTAVGYSSMYTNSGGYQNVAIGTSSLYLNVSGTLLTAIGYRALYSNTTGSENTAVGHRALYTNSSGQFNTALGSQALYSNTTQGQNTAVGYQASYTNSTGSQNVSLGYQSLYLNLIGSQNTAIGSNSLRSNTGSSNTAAGYSALYLNSSGTQNTAVGYNSLLLNTTGSYNTSMGYNSLGTNSTSSYNVAVGFNSLANNSTGTQNTAIGGYAGSSVSTGSNLTLIGYNSSPSIANATNEITLGNNQITTLRCNVQTISSLSDLRDKKNIKDLSLGLDFIMKVKPREFNWDKREWYENGISDGSKIQDHPTAGFVAQEFDSVQKSEHAEWLNLVLKSNPDKWEATYGNLLPVIVKAIQDLKQEKDELKNAFDDLIITNQLLSEQNQNLVQEINLFKEQFQVQLEKLMSQSNSATSEKTEVSLED
jgi:trimeric autotransporter adhesin